MPLILSKQSEYEFEEKKSKFLAYCLPVATEDGALQFLKSIQKRHSDASHNCYAYSIQGGATRFSDDGEPQGTAGMPILNVFQKQGITNFICVVTRYYGGIQLGTGGLVRAYSSAAKGAITASGTQEFISYKTFKVKCVYSNLDKVKYHFDKLGIKILNQNFTDQCELEVSVKEDLVEQFLKNDFYVIVGE